MVNSGWKPASAFVPSSHQAAAMSLVDFGVVRSMAFRSKTLLRSPEKVHPDLLRFSRALQKECHARGWPMYVFEYGRSDQRQEALYKRGVSKARAGQSAHNSDEALDLIHAVRLWDLTEKEWAVIGLVGKEVARRANLKVTWGGDWSFWDPAHWELKDWRTN